MDKPLDIQIDHPRVLIEGSAIATDEDNCHLFIRATLRFLMEFCQTFTVAFSKYMH